ncbi:hypothetical protein CVS40_12970 [Lucilia cuprina]|nr:hypothetical protein CVS40_12970 [Lucilia cuprina]
MFNNTLSKVAQSNLPSEEAKIKVITLRQSFREYVESFDKNDRDLRPPSSTMQRNAYFKGNFVDEVRASINNFNALYGQLKKRFIEEENLLYSSSQKQDDDTKEPTAQMAQGDRIDLVCQKEATVPLSQKESTAPLLQRDLTDPMWQKEPFLPFLLQREQGLINSGRSDMEKISVRNKNAGLIRQFQYILDDLEAKLKNFKNKEVTIDILKEKFKLAENQFIKYMGEFPDDELTEIFYNLRDEYQNIPGIESYAKTLPFQLPTIDIPTFSGKATEWETFRELFEQLIIDQPVSNTQKMCMLKAKLSGEAAKKISKLPSKDENFEVAWSRSSRFEILHLHLPSFFLPSP